MATKRILVVGLVVALSGVAVALSSLESGQPPATRITLNSSRQAQTFVGWEAAVLGTVLDYRQFLEAFPKVFELAAGDLGINRLQIAFGAGIEHPRGYAERYLKGELPERTMLDQFAYNIVNDNADPHVANLDGFDFTLLDWQMEHIVVPYRRALERVGERLLTNLSYVDFKQSAFEHYAHPEEYAELMLVLFDHLRTRYGFVPDAINVINEPDQRNWWTGVRIGRVIVATADRLAKAGYRPGFIAPSTVSRANTVRFFNELSTVRGAARHVTELSYHCYWGKQPVPPLLEGIARRAVQAGINTAQNECWQPENDFRALHRDLKLGRNSSWQQGTFQGPQGFYAIDRATGEVTLRPKTKILRQYYKHIRPGAVRIDATTTDMTMDPIAFVGVNGRTVVVVAASSAGSFAVRGLPAGKYGISYTTEAAFDVNLADVVVADGQLLTAAIPAAGAITVYGK